VINTFENCTVTIQAESGKQLQKELKSSTEPEILLLDLQMKEMNGFETAQWLHKEYPNIKIMILTMYAFDLSLFKLLKFVAKAFLSKNIDEKELQKAIQDVSEYGFHFSANISPRFLSTMFQDNGGKQFMLSEKKERFLQLASSELTYKEIAGGLNISERCVDKLRNSLFEKLNAKSRVGLTITAMKNGMIPIMEDVLIATP